MYRNVLLPLDGTEFTEHEVEHALHVVAQGGKLTLLHVVPATPLSLLSMDMENAISPRSAEDLEKQHQSRLAYLRSLRARIAHRRRDLSVDVVLSQGELEAAIVSSVVGTQADLVVLAQAHRSLFERIIRSSTTESLLQKISVPALVVHGPLTKRVCSRWSGSPHAPASAYSTGL